MAGHYIEILVVSVAPVDFLLINEYVKKRSHSETLNKNTGLWREKGFAFQCRRVPEGEEFDVAWLLEVLEFISKAFSLALPTHILPQGVLEVQGKVN